MSPSAAGKRKNDAAFPSDDDKMTTTKTSDATSIFGTIPDVSWEAVAAFAAPPDVYHLCLSSAHFHTDPAVAADAGKKMSGSADTKKKSGGKSNKMKARVTTAAASNNQPSLLATRLLRKSLLSSLGRVLDKSESGITLQSALEMSSLPERSAIIAGSTMAATVLGEVWSGASSYTSSKQDVDIFCTAKAAPQVRSVSSVLLQFYFRSTKAHKVTNELMSSPKYLFDFHSKGLHEYYNALC